MYPPSSGTGASAIYPLLACRQRPNYKFLATESDAKSYAYAVRNIKRNGLDDRIEVINVEDDGGKGGPLVPESVLSRFEKYVLYVPETLLNFA